MVIILINGYRIKKVNNEDILYIYLDYNSEFARLDKKNTKTIKSNIKKYIKSNKIDFKGSVVALVVGGVLVGTITLNQPKAYNNNYTNNSRIVAIIDKFENSLEDEDNFIIDEKIDVKETENNDSNISEKKQTENTRSNNKSSEKSIVNSNGNEDSFKEKEEITEKSNESKTVDLNIYINLYRKNGDVLEIELEEYIIGVVGAEMPASFNSEALKAQAIVSRTYAIKALNINKKLTDDTTTQNYKSNDELKKLWGNNYNTYYEKIKNAVLNTKGLYLAYNGDIIDAVYHSTSNGYTEDSVNVWGNIKPYLKSVSSEYDNTNKSFITIVYMSYDEVSNKLNNSVNENTLFNIISRNESGRVSNIEINGNNYTGVEMRTLLGLRSADFEIEKVSGGVNITTKGYGHGVGMSQYGANGMANNGSNYRDILLHYYTGVSIKSL